MPPQEQAPKILLSINAGSSSLKTTLYTYTTPSQPPVPLANISITSLTSPPAKLSYTLQSASEPTHHNTPVENISDLPSAWKKILHTLLEDEALPQLHSAADISLACHRIVHGGSYSTPVRIDRDTLHHLDALSSLAPLHNGPALQLVRALHTECPETTNLAFFDTAFHSTLSKPTRTYAIDPKIAEERGLRKYGFHGLSHAFIARAVGEWLGKGEVNLISLHLGSGMSACCIRAGESVDTTMGLTPLAGLPGATRSGDVDPSLIFHYTRDAGELDPAGTKDLHITTAERILNQESGWKAMTGTADFGEICRRVEAGEGGVWELVFEMVVERIVGFVAAYWVKLGGEVDGLVFAGGVGEKGALLRRAVGERVACLGFKIDNKKNGSVGDGVVVDIGGEGGKGRVLVVQTDEQEEMARECVQDLEKLVGK